MLRILALLAAAAALFAADNPWTKVKELKSGTEIRVFKKGGPPPVIAKIDEADDERLVVVLKNEQVAIPREEIDRIDYRPPQTGSRIKKETKSSDPELRPGPPVPQGPPRSSTSSSVAIVSKPDFELLYRRPPAPVKK